MILAARLASSVLIDAAPILFNLAPYRWRLFILSRSSTRSDRSGEPVSMFAPKPFDKHFSSRWWEALEGDNARWAETEATLRGRRGRA